MKNSMSCIFGFVNNKNNKTINSLGKFCGIDEHKLCILVDPDRSFFDRITDIFLLDLLSQIANDIGQTPTQMFRMSGPGDKFNDLFWAQKDLFSRKVITASLTGLHLCVFLALGPTVLTLSIILSVVGISYILAAWSLFAINHHKIKQTNSALLALK